MMNTITQVKKGYYRETGKTRDKSVSTENRKSRLERLNGALHRSLAAEFKLFKI